MRVWQMSGMFIDKWLQSPNSCRVFGLFYSDLNYLYTFQLAGLRVTLILFMVHWLTVLRHSYSNQFQRTQMVDVTGRQIE